MSDAPPSPLISVISITLNDPEGLTRTIKSLRTQIQAPDYEHIIVDGVSNYDVEKLLADLGSSARLYRGCDAGLYDAMNRGTDLARGDYLLYLNGGDTLSGPDVLSAVGAELVRKRPDFLYGDSVECQQNGSIDFKAARGCESVAIGMFTHHQSMVFNRAILSKYIIRYDLSYPIAADYDFILHYLSKSVTTIRFPGAIASFSAGGISQIKHHAGRREQFLVRKRYFKSFTFAARVYLIQTAGKYLRVASPKIYWGMREAYTKIFW